jgi:hypothetical protein
MAAAICSHASWVLVLRLVEVDLPDLGVIPLLISSRGSSINISKDEGSLGFRPVFCVLYLSNLSGSNQQGVLVSVYRWLGADPAAILFDIAVR